MKHLLACLLLACGAPPKPLTEIETVPTNQVEEPAPPANTPGTPIVGKGFLAYEGFPIPYDANDEGAGSAGSRMFSVPRERDAVHDELVPHLRAEGWAIKYLASDGATQVDDKTTMMGGYRMYVSRGAKRHFVSVTEIEPEITLISITLKPVD